MATFEIKVDTDVTGAESVVRRVLHGLSEEFTASVQHEDGEFATITADVINDGVRETLYADDIRV